MPNKIILVTGSNRGLGLATLTSLAQREPSYTYLLCSRTLSDAESAITLLRSQGITAAIHPVRLDVTSESDIDNAVHQVQTTYGRLDVLIHNAGFARAHTPNDRADLRDAYRNTFEVNVTSIVSLSSAFEELLRAAPEPRVVIVGSSRGSMTRASDPKTPPTMLVSYSLSKVAVNALGLEMIKAERAREVDGGKVGRGIEVYVACPGFCKTRFNGFKGVKEPEDGARVVVELVMAEKGVYEPGCWEFGDDLGKEVGENLMRVVPW